MSILAGGEDIDVVDPYANRIEAPSPKHMGRRTKTLDFVPSNLTNFDDSIHHSITQRRMNQFEHNPSLLFQDPNSHDDHLYDQFLIIGLPPQSDPEESEPSPKILFMYPSSPAIFESNEYEQLPLFCFPNGFQKYDRFKKIIYQFVFKLKESKGSTIYGICIQMSVNRLSHKLFFADEVSREYPFCFCFLTRNPVLAPNMMYLSFLTLWMTHQTEPIRHKQFAKCFNVSSSDMLVRLPNLVNTAGCLKNPNFKVPIPFMAELAFYRSLQINNTDIQRIRLSNNLNVFLPETNGSLNNIFYPSLSVLFSNLSLRHIIKLYSLIILEAHIVFMSRDVHVLTLSVLSAVELAAPFELNAMVMPVLPKDSSYLQLLDSPCPYIIGLVKDDVGYRIPAGVTVVDLDHDTINDPDKNPDFPFVSKFEHKLAEILKENEPSVLVPPKVLYKGVFKKTDPYINPKYVDFIKHTENFTVPRFYIDLRPPKYVFTEKVVTELVKAFETVLSPLAESLVWACLVTDTTDVNNPITVFNRDLFLASCEPHTVKFFDNFLNTTVFQRFCDQKIDEKEATVANTVKHHSKRKRRGEALPDFILGEMYYGESH
ncbi:hypothetical protein TRFO_22866 [Tritrichomonas foetus]|uniref:UDENN domain-containing protein n=1 Tax=Tritrichomonas foetus TaxID=1144522 RepID=A0A1J4KAS6_9EUKA|nr:hypothetical protein TRFO_22866 [Tritrichomonas foetus]|eukprot:OHT08535.1 hypothetical protein TRFO_22866 [Tritrichomonas foetus]